MLSRNAFVMAACTLCVVIASLGSFGESALAFAQAFRGGDPSVITFDPKKSAALGVKVRRFPIGKRVYYIPTPPGFRDIEELSRETLPERLHLPAFNVRDFTLTYVALDPIKAKPGQAVAGYSLAEVDICAPRHGSVGICWYPDKKIADLAPSKDCDAVFPPTQGGDQRLAAMAEDLRTFDEGYNEVACKYSRQGSIVTVYSRSVTGDWIPQERARAFEKAEQAMATGGVLGPQHAAVAAAVRFMHKGRGVTLEVLLGPELGAADFKRAHDLVMLWQKMFLWANP